VGNNNEKFRDTDNRTGENRDDIILINVAGINQTLWMVVDTWTQVSCVKTGI